MNGLLKNCRVVDELRGFNANVTSLRLKPNTEVTEMVNPWHKTPQKQPAAKPQIPRENHDHSYGVSLRIPTFIAIRLLNISTRRPNIWERLTSTIVISFLVLKWNKDMLHVPFNTEHKNIGIMENCVFGGFYSYKYILFILYCIMFILLLK